ncbi:c-type cytochrome [Calycomorphotria hydatis]|uniref:Cytochrome c6 n=1 Tax=Calycomorphotria hydatis TaxID=2528027 RepID=A0A517TCQ9_9PLAN|nr:cytochrome c [Calycomorphotria hydatis]QDT66148.1 Cytochrome c6 [Calycomorphotria hydatis]
MARFPLQLCSICLLTTLLMLGCGELPTFEFPQSEKLNELIPQFRDGATVTDEEGEKKEIDGIAVLLDHNFGTPTVAQVWDILPVKFGTDEDKTAELDYGRAVYLRHCRTCHGLTGAGDGPSGYYLYPKPRDFRLGVFKWTSTEQTAKASRADIMKVLQHGIAGTSMPAFSQLSQADLDAVTEYVRWLAMRGEYEQKLVNEVYLDFSKPVVEERLADGETQEELDEEINEFLLYDFPDSVEFVSEDLAETWTEADEEDVVIEPKSERTEPTPESIARGREVYISEKGKCISCHGKHALGDGPQATSFQIIPGSSEKYPEPGLHDVWGNVLQPRNLRKGVFAGGKEPVDLYRRIYAGIKGTPMPAFGASLTEEEIWDLVNYLLWLPDAPGEEEPEGSPEAPAAA